MSIQAEMPRYRSYKRVWALKIKELVPELDGYISLIPEEEGYAFISLDKEYVDKYRPRVGGYYVVYESGHKSFITAAVFEDSFKQV